MALKFQASITKYLATVKPFVKEKKWPAFQREAFYILSLCIHNRLVQHGVTVLAIQNELGAHRKRWQHSIRAELPVHMRIHEQWLFLVANTLQPPSRIPAEYQALALIQWRGVVDDDIRIQCWTYFKASESRTHDAHDVLALEIDLWDAREKYCKLQLPGHEYLRLVDTVMGQPCTGNISPALQAAIRSDSIHCFKILHTLDAEQVSYDLFTDILCANASTIMTYMLRFIHYKKNKTLLEQLPFCVCGNMRINAKIACTVIRTIEEIAPGMTASMVDPFGNNLLWYASAFRRRPYPDLIQTLLECGVDPDHRNHLDLSYSMIASWSANKMKKWMMP